MSLVARLARFADTASFGEMRVGASLDAVERVHGEAADYGSTTAGRQWPRRFGYGDVELFVCRCRRVNLVYVDTWRDEVELPQPSGPGCQTLPGGPAYDEVTEALDAAGVGWRPHRPLTLAGQTALIADITAVTFVFVVEDGAPPYLNIVSAPGDNHECPKPRPAAPR